MTTENSCLLNNEQEKRIRLYCRIRPALIYETSGEEKSTCVKRIDHTHLALDVPAERCTLAIDDKNEITYSFTHVFDESSSQKDLYETVGLPLVQALLMGNNGLLITYGAIGSGKTYTMTGEPHDLGIMHRSLHTIFNSLPFLQTKKCMFVATDYNSYKIKAENVSLGNKRSIASSHSSTASKNRVRVNVDHIYAVFVRCVEIYNNYVYDLLDESSVDAKSLQEADNGTMYVKEAREIEVKSTGEAVRLMERAQQRRLMVVSCRNDIDAASSIPGSSTSSQQRSHSIFTIRVVQAAYDPVYDTFDARVITCLFLVLSQNSIQVSELVFVDLAFSELLSPSTNLIETGSIASSIMALRNCLETATFNMEKNRMGSSREQIPYRESKLTLLLKNFFDDDQSQISMILCVQPNLCNFDETVSVLKFSVDMTEAVKKREAKNELDNLICFDTQMTTSFQSLIEYLEELQRNRNASLGQIDMLESQLRSQLMLTQTELETVRREKNELQLKLNMREKDLHRAESKLRALEKIVSTQHNGIKRQQDENNNQSDDRSFDLGLDFIHGLPPKGATSRYGLRSCQALKSTRTSLVANHSQLNDNHLRSKSVDNTSEE